MSNPNFDAIISTTLKNYRPTLNDNLTNHQALTFQLNKKGYVREDRGGTTIVEPLLYGRNTTVKSYDGYDIIDTSPQEGITSAEFNWKQIAGSVTISGREEFINSGSKTQVISLLRAKMTQLEMSMQIEMNAQLQGDGTGNAGKDLTGLQLAIEDGNAWSTYGGIDSNAYAYWRNQWIGNNGGGTITFGTTSTYGVLIRIMTTMYNSCMRGTIRPTLIVTDQQIYEIYEQFMQFTSPNYQIPVDREMADAGFMNLAFKGVPMVFDQDNPGFAFGASNNHEMRFLNADFLRLVIGSGKNMVTTDFQRPENQDARVAQTLWYGNLTCANRQRQGLINIDLI
jgi:hypothetical protein